MLNYFSKHFNLIISACISILIFQLKFGLDKLIPTNINWLMEVRHDWGQHYLGWAFYRNESWTFPIGTIDSYYHPISTNVGLTDSIPLFAMPFKLFSSFLPSDFQYFGIWFFLCFLLMSFFIIKMLTRYNFSKIQLVIFSVLFTANPVLLFREIHPALCAHWLILAAIYLYTKPVDKENTLKANRSQFILLIISSLVHPYLTLIVFGFTVILPLKNYFYDKSLTIKQLIFIPVLSMLALLVVWYSVGYLSFSGTVDNGIENSFGKYSMNLNAFFDSRGYSSILSEQKSMYIGQYEGYMYFGVGLLLFGIFTLSYFLLRNIKTVQVKKYFYFLPLLFFCFAILLFSVTNTVTFSDKILLEFDIPNFITKIGNVFRASSRTFWVVFYLILLFFAVLFSKLKINNIIKSSILIVVLGVQFYDIHLFFKGKDFDFGTYDTPLEESRWNPILSKFKQLKTFPLFDFEGQKKPYDYQDLAFLSHKNDLTYSNGLSARMDRTSQDFFTNAEVSKLIKEPIPKGVLYVTTQKYLSNFSVSILKHNASMSYMDGYFLIYSQNDNILVNQNKSETEMLSSSMASLDLHDFEILEEKIVETNDVKMNLELIIKTKEFIKIKGWAFVEGSMNNEKDSVFLILQNKSQSYIGYLKSKDREDVTTFFNAENLDNSGIESINSFSGVRAGIYQLGIGIREKTGNWSFRKTDETVEIKFD